jgi:hypothetical protein
VPLNNGEDNAANGGNYMPTSAPAKTSCPAVITSVAIFGIVFDDDNDSGYFDIEEDNETGFPKCLSHAL